MAKITNRSLLIPRFRVIVSLSKSYYRTILTIYERVSQILCALSFYLRSINSGFTIADLLSNLD